VAATDRHRRTVCPGAGTVHKARRLVSKRRHVDGEETKENKMKKLVFAVAALALAMTAGSGLFGQAQAAAAAKSPECANAARAGDASWQEHYHCWTNGQGAATAKTVPIAAQPQAAPGAKSPECANAARAGDASWQEHYHCWK